MQDGGGEGLFPNGLNFVVHPKAIIVCWKFVFSQLHLSSIPHYSQTRVMDAASDPRIERHSKTTTKR